jgi:hypothetical protein
MKIPKQRHGRENSKELQVSKNAHFEQISISAQQTTKNISSIKVMLNLVIMTLVYVTPQL